MIFLSYYYKSSNNTCLTKLVDAFAFAFANHVLGGWKEQKKNKKKKREEKREKISVSGQENPRYAP
jgi:hypothetical protein